MEEEFIIEVMDNDGNIDIFKTNNPEEYVEMLALLQKNSTHYKDRLDFVQKAEEVSSIATYFKQL